MLCLLAGMLSFAPARVVQAGPETVPPAGLNAADWAQIESLLSQRAYLKASNTGASDEFGYSVAISGDTVVVGAYNEDSSATGVNGDQNDNSAINSGAAYVFTRSGTIWSQEAYLKASNTEAGDNFGFSVAIDGDTIVVGAHGEDSNSPIVNGNQTDNSTPGSGAAYVFTRSGTTWSQQAYLKSATILRADMFGYSVAISRDTIVVGAYGEDSMSTGVNSTFTKKASLSGAAYVFTRSGITWSQQAYLKASNTELGDYFGWSVAVSGDTVVVGAFGEDSLAAGVNGDQTDNSAGSSGAAYIFTRDGTTWSQQSYLKASNTGASDYFGFSVAIDGDTVVIGAEYEDSGASGVNGDESNDLAAESGAAYVFTRDGTTWNQQAYLKASNTGASDQFGSLVAISGDTVVVGAPFEDSSASGVNGDQNDNSAVNSGAAYIFTRDGTTWSQQSYLKASNTGAYDYFGFSLAIDGDTMIAGAPYEDSNASGVNGDQTNNSAASSGAAYIVKASILQTLTFRSVGADDGWILETGENTNKGGTLNSTTNTLRLGDDAAKKQYRSILSFATGADLPDDAVITKVTLKVRMQGITGGGNPVSIFKGFMVDMRQGVFGASTLQSTDFQTAAGKTYGPFRTALAGGWYTIDLTSGNAYINKLDTGLTQLRLRFQQDDNNNTIANYLSLHSGNAGAASRPQLIIEYYVP
ncbi:MAG: integrin [Chloroflexota bacterium]